MALWQPGQYLKFQNERTQPSIDLVNRINLDAPGRIIDIGCGPGNSTAVLKGRWPKADVYGLDNSASMLERARGDYPGIEWLQMGANDDLSPLGKFDIVFSNAALQWIPSHERLLPGLFHMLNKGGVLAVQVPYVRELPVYAQILSIIQKPAWKEYFQTVPEFPKHFPFEHYYEILCGLGGKIEAWQTDYIHIMQDHDGIVEWYKGSGLPPFLDRLPEGGLKQAFLQEYRGHIMQAYPVQRDGKVLLPFTRVFFIVQNI